MSLSSVGLHACSSPLVGRYGVVGQYRTSSEMLGWEGQCCPGMRFDPVPLAKRRKTYN